MKPALRQRLLTLVRRNYDEIAADFSRSRENLVWPETEQLIREALLNVSSPRRRGSRHAQQPPLNVLDLGCGNGRLLDILKRFNIHYTGIEQSPLLAEHAHKKIADGAIKNATVIKGDIVEMLTGNSRDPRPAYRTGRLRGDDTTWDVILLIAVLPHIPSRQLRTDVLHGIRERLADNGRLIITCWNLRAHPKHKWAVRKHAILKLLGFNRMEFGDIVFPGFHNRSPRYYHAYTERGLRKELAAADFRIEKLYSDGKNIYAVARK